VRTDSRQKRGAIQADVRATSAKIPAQGRGFIQIISSRTPMPHARFPLPQGEREKKEGFHIHRLLQRRYSQNLHGGKSRLYTGCALNVAGSYFQYVLAPG